jgi:hypothetical protein
MVCTISDDGQKAETTKSIFMNIEGLRQKIKDIKDNVSLVEFLTKLGYEPSSKKSGQERFFLSPIRDSDSDPSFSVNDNKGLWYDHGSGQGGNVIDLGMLVFKTNSIPEVVAEIEKLYNGHTSSSFSQRDLSPRVYVPKHEIVNIKDVGNNTAITDYIASRGVLKAALASNLLKEVYYDHIDDKGYKKRYFGVGWQNVSEGYDVRSKYGKICIAKKDLLFQGGSNYRVSIFEGMFNYLSALEKDPSLINNNLIVLNSLSMVGRAITLIKASSSIRDIDLYFDNGSGGKKMTAEFQKQLPEAIDRSYLYQGYDDYNDMLRAVISNRDSKPWQGNSAERNSQYTR